MEQQEKKFKADREDLMRMLAGFESGLIGLPGKAGGAAGAGGVGEVGGDKVSASRVATWGGRGRGRERDATTTSEWNRN